MVAAAAAAAGVVVVVVVVRGGVVIVLVVRVAPLPRGRGFALGKAHLPRQWSVGRSVWRVLTGWEAYSACPQEGPGWELAGVRLMFLRAIGALGALAGPEVHEPTASGSEFGLPLVLPASLPLPLSSHSTCVGVACCTNGKENNREECRPAGGVLRACLRSRWSAAVSREAGCRSRQLGLHPTPPPLPPTMLGMLGLGHVCGASWGNFPCGRRKFRNPNCPIRSRTLPVLQLTGLCTEILISQQQSRPGHSHLGRCVASERQGSPAASYCVTNEAFTVSRS